MSLITRGLGSNLLVTRGLGQTIGRFVISTIKKAKAYIQVTIRAREY